MRPLAWRGRTAGDFYPGRLYLALSRCDDDLDGADRRRDNGDPTSRPREGSARAPRRDAGVVRGPGTMTRVTS